MLLTVLERLTLGNLLPKESDVVTYRIIKKLKENLSPTEEEFKKFNIVANGDKITFKNEEAEVEIGEKATDIIIETLKELDKNKKVDDNSASLFDKFNVT